GTFDNDRNFKLSAFFHQIEAAAMAIGAKVVGLDNVAHLFTGNENVRGEVTQFMNACTRLAMHIGGSVVLLGHPAKIEGSQYSGSTSWE
ncbi:AAA family ATPase, partial [Listeria monocytogenes]|uniref:AAA family ATPase n=1 Tax=Listeria monocytogenes TaxID=1639 RepID=UPI002FDBA822